jgi:hypothetical protein
MRHYYSEVDEVTLTHTDIYLTDSGRRVDVRFERPRETGGFDFAEGFLPECAFNKTFGFSEEELFRLEKYLKNNLFLLWEYAQKGGGENA